MRTRLSTEGSASHYTPAVQELPYLTTDFPGIGGTIKARPEDFFVQEIPLYEPTGEGEHVYVEIEKINATTYDAINRIASALGIGSRDIGFAGMKDARAVTRQTLSIPGVTEEQVMRLQVPDVKPLWAARHGNKLRIGHLKANRFAVKIREVKPTDVIKLQVPLKALAERGMPNYFGEQRFGRRDNNDRLGAAYIRGDATALLSELLGRPDSKVDDEAAMQFRAAFDRGELEEAMRLMPPGHGMEFRVLKRLIQSQRPQAAVWAADDKIRKLWVSALQSRVFNTIAGKRIGSLGQVMNGDVAYKHENGACFTVEDAATEQPRADRFEISPTGPLVGFRVTLPQGEPLAIEQAAFDAYPVSPDDFRNGSLRVKGDRRPLRVQPTDIKLEAGVDEHGSHITVAFTLPAGCFATVLLRELMKNDQQPTESVTA
jgi:tRNA pseudouridine13 synthase